jgi:hypothetical protein
MSKLYRYLGKHSDIVSCFTSYCGSDLLLYGNVRGGGYVHLNTLYAFELAFGATFAEMGEAV